MAPSSTGGRAVIIGTSRRKKTGGFLIVSDYNCTGPIALAGRYGNKYGRVAGTTAAWSKRNTLGWDIGHASLSNGLDVLSPIPRLRTFCLTTVLVDISVASSCGGTIQRYFDRLGRVPI